MANSGDKGGFLIPLALFVFGVSVLAVLVSIVWIIIVAIINAARSSSDGPTPPPSQ